MLQRLKQSIQGQNKESQHQLEQESLPGVNLQEKGVELQDVELQEDWIPEVLAWDVDSEKEKVEKLETERAVKLPLELERKQQLEFAKAMSKVDQSLNAAAIVRVCELENKLAQEKAEKLELKQHQDELLERLRESVNQYHKLGAKLEKMFDQENSLGFCSGFGLGFSLGFSSFLLVCALLGKK